MRIRHKHSRQLTGALTYAQLAVVFQQTVCRRCYIVISEGKLMTERCFFLIIFWLARCKVRWIAGDYIKLHICFPATDIVVYRQHIIKAVQFYAFIGKCCAVCVYFKGNSHTFVATVFPSQRDNSTAAAYIQSCLGVFKATEIA